MRCRECNVDLAESYTVCPLCGSEAYTDKAVLKGVKDAPYPKGVPVRPATEPENPPPGFSFEKIKAYFNF